ncbi:hypothetical protein DRA43_29855 [Micromonospora provocatoris]|nr:hypothetical protein DRA43_29855 [Micromonospora provocatoris]
MLSLASRGGGDAGTDPETYLRDAMREAVSVKQETGQFPRGVSDLSVGDYDGDGVVTFVTDGACDMDRVR